MTTDFEFASGGSAFTRREVNMTSSPDIASNTLAAEREGTVTDVAYVGGAGRSGSTVLALLLAQMPGFVAVGGVNNLWERGLQQNYLCGCGVHFRDCPFWNAVGEEAFGGWGALDADKIVQLKRQVTRYRQWPWHLAPQVRPAFHARLAEYSDYMGRVYVAVRRLSGARVVVDTSHDVMAALVLHRTPNVNGRILHLVRDSRAVAFSLSRRVLRAEVTATPTYMPRYAPVPAGVGWIIANLPYHAVPARSMPRLLIHYESLTASPASEIARVAEFLGSKLAPAELSILGAESIEIADNHMISGNPHRLGRKSVQVRLDDEWRTSMRPLDRIVVTSLTLPLGLAYGYVGARHSTQGRPGTQARHA